MKHTFFPTTLHNVARLLSHALAVLLVIDVFIMEIEFLEFYRDYCAGLDKKCKMQLLWVYGGLIIM